MIALIALGVIAALVLLFIFLPVVAWILVGLVLLILAVVLFVPIGADIGYVGGEFSLAARADGFAIQLIPKKPRDPDKPPKEKKPKKEKPPKEAKPKEEKPKKKLIRKTSWSGNSSSTENTKISHFSLSPQPPRELLSRCSVPNIQMAVFTLSISIACGRLLKKVSSWTFLKIT